MDEQETFTYDDGSKYVGQWKDNKQLKQLQQHGQGTITYADGSKYVGEFKDGVRSGQGTMSFINGKKYVGQWIDDKWREVV